MMNHEPCSSVFVVSVPWDFRPQFAFELVVEAVFLAVDGGADVVEDGHDSWRSPVLDQLTDDGVVEVLDFAPFDAFLDVFFLCEKREGENGYFFKLNCEKKSDEKFFCFAPIFDWKWDWMTTTLATKFLKSFSNKKIEE